MTKESSFSNLRPVDQNYEYDHFAGSQISIYVGDVLIDEINRIDFRVTQNKQLIYGYASQYYDAVASGQVVVNGSFLINFKEAGYMHLILKRYLEAIGSEGEASSETLARDLPFEQSQVLRRNIERILEDQEKSKKNTQEPNPTPQDPLDKFKFYTDLAALPDSAFENVAEVLEDSLWQEKHKNRENLGNITKNTAFDLDNALRRGDQFPGFTIWITYGDINNPNANHTIRKLTGVHIISSGQTIEISGEPIQEYYEFVARNLL